MLHWLVICPRPFFPTMVKMLSGPPDKFTMVVPVEVAEAPVTRIV